MPTLPHLRASLRLALPLGLLALFAGCDSGGELGGAEDIDFQRLFAEPTAAEVEAVEAEWAARLNPARDVRIVAQTTTDGFVTYVVAHTQTDADGSDFTHYGFIRIPDVDDFPLPVLVYHHDGDDGTALTDADSVLGLFPAITRRTVVVAPVYRSEPLVADLEGLGDTYTAGGDPSPWDRDVDDAIGFLNAALSLFPDAADGTRVAALGLGRGGNTALLHALRDDRIDAVTDYFGPADFFNVVARLLAFQLANDDPDVLGLPGAAYLADEVLDPLVDGTRSYDSARLELVRRSPGLFAERLPDTQLHHHQGDEVIPVGFAVAFIARVEASAFDGTLSDHLYSGAPPAGVETLHRPESMPESLGRTERFLLARLAPPAP